MRQYDYSENVALNEWEQDIPDTDELPLVLPRRYDVKDLKFPRLLEDFEWQVTYKFPSARRKNFFGVIRNGKQIKYGSDNMTFRRLYLILCKFNNGISFIDDYIKNVLPSSAVGEELQSYLMDVKANAEAEWLNLYEQAPKRKRDGGVYKRWLPKFEYLRSVTDDNVKSYGSVIATRIKEDLVASLRDGRVPLSTTLVSDATKERRKLAGLNPEPRFYASSQFINSVKIYCRLERKGEWQTDTWV